MALDARRAPARSAASVSASQAATAARDLGRAHAHAGLGEIEAVELLRQLDERRVAARAHVGDDGAHRRVDVLGGLALGGEEGRERALEVGIAVVRCRGMGSLGLRRRLAASGV